MSGVNIAGVVHDGMGGLKESQTKFRRHNQEVGDALLNIGGIGTLTGAAVDKDDARPPYVPQYFPKMLYQANGRELIVKDDAELSEALVHGWRKTPYPKVQIEVLDPATEKKNLMDRNLELQANLARLMETQNLMAKELEEMRVAKARAKG